MPPLSVEVRFKLFASFLGPAFPGQTFLKLLCKLYPGFVRPLSPKEGRV